MDRAGWRFTCKSAAEEFEVRRSQELEAKRDLRKSGPPSTSNLSADLPPNVSLTDWASCPQQVTLVMMRPVVLTAQSMMLLNYVTVLTQRTELQT